VRTLFITHKTKQCGVKEHGHRFLSALVEHSPPQDEWISAEVSSAQEIRRAVDYHRPGVTVVNLHPLTTPPLPNIPNGGFNTRLVALPHENLTSKAAGSFLSDYKCFSAVLWQDPTLVDDFPGVYKIGRVVPRFLKTRERRKYPKTLIKVFGFGFGDKQPELMIKLIEESFDSAVIEGHFPTNEIADPDGRNGEIMMERLSKAVTKPGLEVVSSWPMLQKSYMPQNDMIEWLSESDVNLSLHGDGTGIASTTDLMLAARAPFAVNDSPFFRHLPSEIKIRPGNPIKGIMAQGIEPWKDLVDFEWSPARFSKNVNEALKRIVS